MLKRLRERAGSESGFTLIELLVVMLILGILAAIAIPAFLNQKSKANDASAKVMARTMQTAEETCATDNNGSYSNCNLTALQAIEPAIATGGSINALSVSGLGTNAYTVTATASSTLNDYTVTKSGGTATRTCTVGSSAQAGGCQGAANTSGATGTW
jgi:type IV pilus assembly protein PilA